MICLIYFTFFQIQECSFYRFIKVWEKFFQSNKINENFHISLSNESAEIFPIISTAEKCLYSEFFVRMRENTDQKKLQIRTLFTQRNSLAICKCIRNKCINNFALHSSYCAKKWTFPLRISSVNVIESAIYADLVTFTVEILSGKLHFLRAVSIVR